MKTPAMGRFFLRFNRSFDALTGRYVRGCSLLLCKATATCMIQIGFTAMGLWMGRKVSSGFLPEEDQGYLLRRHLRGKDPSIELPGPLAPEEIPPVTAQSNIPFALLQIMQRRITTAEDAGYLGESRLSLLEDAAQIDQHAGRLRADQEYAAAAAI